jgi:hypothetical protein
LQFLTNLLTAAPVYYLTYWIGHYALIASGLLASADLPKVAEEDALLALASKPGLSEKFATTTAALFVGGTLCGIALAITLDVIYFVATRSRGARA